MKKHLLKMLASAALSVTFNAGATEILVPAYFYPSTDPHLSFWDEMTVAASQGVGITAIMNPASGPSDAVNADYTSAVNAFRAAGGKVIGYVSTQHGARDANAVLADVTAYKNFYTIDGIFLDEMHNIPETLSYYQALRTNISGIHAGYKVFGNPGTTTLEGYTDAADVLVTFENFEGYTGYTPAAWEAGYSANRFAHLLYDVQTTAEMQAALALAATRNVGYLYVTNDRYSTIINPITGLPEEVTNPWDTLPSYWGAEVAAISAVPEPSTLALFLAGLGLMGWQIQRRKRCTFNHLI